ncbi:uncharacterized protein BDV17DRAFT_138413 [Aspergillus undulatus]|uniref:uncharacterized protein n=1 Tax=Aspergillus undulatus TaxID=1810928 RepID=UPI003CCD60DC
MPPQHPTSSTTIYLDQPPSCLQFCPASPNYFVIGTYLLSETKVTEEDGTESISQKKTGSLQLWHLDEDRDELTQISRYPLNAAVFDLQFKDRNSSKSSSPSNIFAIATSDASVSFFTVSSTGFTRLWTRTVHEDLSTPALYLAWLPENWLPFSGSASRGEWPRKEGFAVTFSDGKTGVFGIDGPINAFYSNAEEKATEIGAFEAKQPIEIWFVAVASYANTSTEDEDEVEAYTPYLFTGNDFGSLHTRRFTDIQSHVQDDKEEDDADTDDTSPLTPILSTDDRALHHTAGVTSIIPLPIPLSHPVCNGAPLLLTGSYDESLRVYHASGRGRVLGEMGLGGGVWRLQILYTCTVKGIWTLLVLASCMHGGTRVVKVRIGEREEEVGIEVLAEFTEHESMNYASDVWRGTGVDAGGSGSERRVVSSSFYDRRVCVWRVTV